ncbi:NACHT domain-containing protein [Micromonospora sp. NPDC050417]|uniref:NACHT domain-containing protein n=1 Tax=Micromonospora sp. NPDC050417 TaxID=3364280 RepID=UPI00379E4385
MPVRLPGEPGRLIGVDLFEWVERFDNIVSIVVGTVAVLAMVGGSAAWQRRRPGRAETVDSVRALVAAQRDTVPAHAYQFLDGSVAALSAIYVRQRVVPGTGPIGPVEAFDADRLLRTDSHLLLVGAAGSGKTTFVGHAVRELARSFSGTVRGRGGVPEEVGLALPATVLVDRSLPEALAEAYRFGVPAVSTGQPPGRHGRWLVLVDGVDRISDPNTRSRVLGQLREWAARVDHPYRLMVTTRPLAAEEATALRTYFAEHHLLPFEADDLSIFAERWFRDRVPDPERANRDSDRFRVDLARVELDGLTGNPLLVTLAALSWERRPGTLPPGPPELLDRFVPHLIESGAAVMDEVAAVLGRRGVAGTEVAAWLDERIEGACEAAAAGWLRDGGAVTAAVDWTNTYAPVAPGGLLRDWPGRVRALLLATGLFLPRGADVEPLTRAVAEYLAAGPVAREWQEARWLELMADPSTRGKGAFVLARAGRATESALTRLAGGTGPQVLAAGHLVGAGIPMSVEVRDMILAALLRLWQAGEVSLAGECLSVLAELAKAPAIRRAVFGIAADPRWPRQVRRAANTFVAVPSLRQSIPD